MTPEERKAKKNAYRAEWRKRNPERDRAANARWRAKNPEANKAHCRKYYQENRVAALATRAAYVKRNREKLNKISREYRQRNPDKARFWRMKSMYGLTPETVASLMEKQAYRCPGCLQLLTLKTAFIDHEHEVGETHHKKRGRVRGLLCVKCNAAIGMGDDSPFILRRLADYLERVEEKLL